MEEIITGKDVGNKEKGRILLPRLKLLELQHMSNLKIIFGVSCEIELPVLESLKLKQCNKVKSISDGLLKMPLLEGIEINGSFHILTKDHNFIFTGVPTLHNFTFADVKIATKNFSSDNLLGEGSFSKVYKGWIDRKTFAPSNSSTGMLVSVKRYNKTRGLSYFYYTQREVEILKSRSHPGLVKLLGHCLQDKEPVLVYEFVPGGTLYDYLSTGIPLPWVMRIKIAIQVARGLNYLHTSEPKVIHKDIQPHNILLDIDHNSKIADFGLSVWGPSDEDPQVTPMNIDVKISGFHRAKAIPLGKSEARISSNMGTPGYIAPEMYAAGQISVKADVYSFGVVLSQLMMGLEVSQVYKKLREEEVRLDEWLKSILSKKRELKETVDSAMQGQYSSKAMLLMVELVLNCIKGDPKKRPTMGEVLEKLQEIDAIEQKHKHVCQASSSPNNH